MFDSSCITFAKCKILRYIILKYRLLELGLEEILPELMRALNSLSIKCPRFGVHGGLMVCKFNTNRAT